MSDYCKGCHYDSKQRVGERACPYNALYWDFFMRHAAVFDRNPRLAMVYRQLANMPAEALDALRAHAASLRARLETL